MKGIVPVYLVSVLNVELQPSFIQKLDIGASVVAMQHEAASCETSIPYGSQLIALLFQSQSTSLSTACKKPRNMAHGGDPAGTPCGWLEPGHSGHLMTEPADGRLSLSPLLSFCNFNFQINILVLKKKRRKSN